MGLRAAMLLAPLLLAPALAMPGPSAGEAPAWAPAGPTAGPVQALGGHAAVLLAGTFRDGLLRSTDGGATWLHVEGFPDTPLARIAHDPAHPATFYAAGFGGVARSTDGGLTWARVLDVARAARIDVSPWSGAVLVGARLADGSNRVLRSGDGGATWTDLGAPLPAHVPLCGVAFGRHDGELLAQTDTRSWFSHDHGATWAETPGGGFDFAVPDDGTVWRSDMARLQRTWDGGATWRDVPTPGFATAIGGHPAGGVWLASPEGLLRTRDGGATWANLGHSLHMTQVEGVLADPRDPDAALVADRRVGIARIAPAPDGTSVFEGAVAALPRAPVAALAASPDGGLLLSAGPAGLWASADGGARWSHAGAGFTLANVTAAAAGAGGAARYVGGQDAFGVPAVEASRDGGRTFEVAALPGAGRVVALAAHAEAPLRAYAAVHAEPLGGVYATSDGGLTWAALLELPAPVRDLAWDPAQDALLAATGAGLMAHRDGLWVPLGAPDGAAVAVGAGRVAAGAAAAPSVWRTVGLPAAAPLPWADAGGAVADLAVAPEGAVWAARADGAVQRCTGSDLAGACGAAGPPAAVEAMLAAGPVWAAGPGGVWRSDP